MFSWFLICAGVLNGYFAFQYGFSSGPVDKFLVFVWGIFVAISLVGDGLKRIIVKRIKNKTEARLKEITDPIMNNINLTDEEKKERIALALKYETQKMLKQAGGNNERSN